MNTLQNILIQAWNVTAVMAPYLLLGFFVAGVLGAFIPVRFIETHLGKRGVWQIVKASLLGVPIPLCSCSVIPVSASLRKHGATRGATISFLTSTPQTGIDSIAATWGLLGPLFAVFRTLVAFITGVICGASVEAFTAAQDEPTFPPCDDQCPSCHPAPKAHRWKQVFGYGFGTLPRDISKALLVGILVSGLLSALMPADFFTRYIASEWISMLAVLGLGIPLYVCSTGSIPIALAMIGMGLSPGAALVFLITGPATNAATIATVLKTLGKKAAGIYLMTLAACSLAAGWILNRIFNGELITEQIQSHETEAGLWVQLSGVLLTALLVYSICPTKKKACCHEH